MTETAFHKFYEASPDAVVVTDRGGKIVFANSRCEALLGYQSQELVGRSHSDLVPARYRDAHLAHMSHYMSGPTSRMMRSGQGLGTLRKDGHEILTEISLSPFQAPAGLVVIVAMRDLASLGPGTERLESENSGLRNLLGQARIDAARLLKQAGIDASEHEAASKLQRLLLEELHHRMKNMFAMISGISSQTLRAAETLEQGRLAISSRLAAMGRAQDLLLHASDTGAQLTDIISAAIEPFNGQPSPRFLVRNAQIEIGPGAILPLTMSLNELCTNALKYGALSNDVGQVSIHSEVDEDAQLFSLTWTERGGPVAQEPTRRSFGSRLLTGLAAQLHGDLKVSYEPTGFSYRFDIPLALLGTIKSSTKSPVADPSTGHLLVPK